MVDFHPLFPEKREAEQQRQEGGAGLEDKLCLLRFRFMI